MKKIMGWRYAIPIGIAAIILANILAKYGYIANSIGIAVGVFGWLAVYGIIMALLDLGKLIFNKAKKIN
jgi:hypothetical protein